MAMFGNIFAPNSFPTQRNQPLLGDILTEISQAQRARQMDELNLKKAQMSLADVERQRADEARMRGELQRISEIRVPEATGMTPDTGVGLNPLSPVPMMPDIQSRQRPLNDEEVDGMLEQAALKAGNYDMLQKVRQNLVNKRAERSIREESNAIRRQQLLQSGMTAFTEKPERLRLMAQTNPGALEAMGFNVQAINALPAADIDPEAKPQSVTLPNGRVRLFFMSKSGVPHFVDKFTTNMADADDEMARQFIMEKIRYGAQVGAEAQIRVGQELGRNVEEFTDAQGRVWKLNKSPGGGATPFVTRPSETPAATVQPVEPGSRPPLPATVPPGISAPRPAPVDASGLGVTPEDQAAMDRKFLIGEGSGTADISANAAPPPASGTTMTPLYGQQLTGSTKTPDLGREVNNILGAIRQNPDLKRFEPVNVVASKLESEFNPEMINPDGSYTRAVTNPGIQDNILLQQFLSAFDPKVGIIRPAEIEKFMAQYALPVRMSQMALRAGLGQGYDENGVGEMVAIMTPSMRRSMLDAMNRLLSKATEQMAPAYSEALNSTTSETTKARVRSSIPAIVRRVLENPQPKTTPTPAAKNPNKKRFKMGADGSIMEVK